MSESINSLVLLFHNVHGRPRNSYQLVWYSFIPQSWHIKSRSVVRSAIRNASRAYAQADAIDFVYLKLKEPLMLAFGYLCLNATRICHFI
jgi:hypothetical protein